ncbi:MAG: uridine kinase [Defluviitaleaceae bacterium]|nr:uridine kinase [Defluviitaleaceae bacterium]
MASNTQDKIIAKIEDLAKQQDFVIVAIDGDAAGGKTTLAKTLSEHFKCNVIHMDDFFVPQELRTTKRTEEIGGNIHYERFEQEVIIPLAQKQPVNYRRYDCSIWSYADEIIINPQKIIIIEGSYSLHPNFIDIYDLKIFINIDETKQMLRITARNGETMAQKFKQIWIPMEKTYQNRFQIKSNCDFIINA